MSYCTRADLEARLSAATVAILADPDQDGHEETASVAQAITDIDGLIDGALAVRWSSLLGQTSALLTMIAVDLVIGRLARGVARTDEIVEREADAVRRLRQIQSGDLHPAPSTAGTTAGDEELALFASGRRVFAGGGF